MRKPLTGLLTMRIHAVKDVDHATSSRFSRGPETFVIVKVEDTIKARTKATRNDKWIDESFSIDIDKANEVELTVYDKSGDRPTPIGMLWVRVTDIAEEMRRKKIETELNASGWVSADKMSSPGTPRTDQPLGSPGSSHGGPGGGNFGASAAPGGGPHGHNPNTPPSVMIDSWFALEPFGRIHLQMSFGKGDWSYSDAMIFLAQQTNNLYSQTVERSPPLRYRSQPTGCRAPEKGRGPRKAGSQVCHPAVLQHHALCPVWRFPQVRRRHAMRRLQVHLPQEVLRKGGHKMYQQGELRDRPR